MAPGSATPRRPGRKKRRNGSAWARTRRRSPNTTRTRRAWGSSWGALSTTRSTNGASPTTTTCAPGRPRPGPRWRPRTSGDARGRGPAGPPRLEAPDLRAVRGGAGHGGRRKPRGRLEAVAPRARRPVPVPPPVAGAGGRARCLPGHPPVSVRPGVPHNRRVGAGRARDARDRRQRRRRVPVHPVRIGQVRARWARRLPRRVLARGLRRRAVPAVPRRDCRARDVRRGPVPHGHREGLGPGRDPGRPPGARLQLRLQPVVLVRSPVVLSAGSAGQSARRGGPRRRTVERLIRRRGLTRLASPLSCARPPSYGAGLARSLTLLRLN